MALERAQTRQYFWSYGHPGYGEHTRIERVGWQVGNSHHDGACIAWMDEAECGACGNQTLCLLTDSSDDEYGPVRLCQSCITAMFAHPDAQSPSAEGQ